MIRNPHIGQRVRLNIRYGGRYHEWVGQLADRMHCALGTIEEIREGDVRGTNEMGNGRILVCLDNLKPAKPGDYDYGLRWFVTAHEIEPVDPDTGKPAHQVIFENVSDNAPDPDTAPEPGEFPPLTVNKEAS